MKRHVTQSNGEGSTSHDRSFQPVFDSRKRKIPALWQRGNRYYIQLRIDLGNGSTAPRRLALEATNLDEAKREMERKRTERHDGKLPQIGHCPKFDGLAAEYLASAGYAQKKDGTQDNERQAIARWNAHLGGVRVDKITLPIIHSYREKRLAGGASPRTVNLDVVSLRNALKYAVERGHLREVLRVKQLKQPPPPKRELLSKEQFCRLLEAAMDKTLKNGTLLRFYLRFLLLSGGREQESLAVNWSDVNFDRGIVTIGRNGTSKNRKERDVDLSPELHSLLMEMAAARPPDSTWLFPSPRRNGKDKAAKSLRESLNIVQGRANLPKVGFHDLRHFFASGCVMAGLDFMTIAAWLGHSDGGILVGKVYGHLADTHKREAAKKLNFLGAGRAS